MSKYYFIGYKAVSGKEGYRIVRIPFWRTVRFAHTQAEKDISEYLGVDEQWTLTVFNRVK